MAVPALAISSFASTSASSIVQFNYEVFLSFRGEDTRKTFTGHLYSRLVRAGINTFKDDEKLDKGDEISRSLPEAIEESRISIIVFSKNYASSTWCLRELVKILECRREPIAQTVLPIFLEGADPSDIRNQTGSFGEALCGHEEKFGSEVVGRWRAALTEAAGLIGWDQKNVADGHESMLIDKVVGRVLSILNPIPSDVIQYPVGIDSHVEEMMGLLNAKSKNVMIIGIWGMGGVGKTTIAKAVYSRIIRIFEGGSFLEGVREASKKHNGLVNLQHQLLFDILKEDFLISNGSDGKALIKRRLCAKKVLVIFDDVDDNDQINALVGEIECFGSGSKVIITTRYKHVLNRQKVDAIYKHKELDTHQSLQLLSNHAFGKDQPPNGFLHLVKSIALATGGLPLALEVLGGYLSDKKELVEWKSTLEKLKKIPNEKIQEKLKISYDSLDYLEKEIFLNIACFLIGMDKEYANYIMEGQLNSIIGIKDLIQKSLVKISYDNKLTMHDLLRDMGKEIVRNESPDKPWKRSRVWSHDEALHVLNNCKGTSNIQGLCLNFDQSEEIALEERHFSAEAFEGLDNLRLLHLDDAHLVGDFNGHLSQLQWLKWRCPSESLPTIFYPKKLIVLDLSNSKIRLWDVCHQNKFADLKVLNLSNCRFLTRTPHFSGFPNLEILNLEYCVELLEVHESIENLKKLVHLDMRNCIKIVELPSSICKLGSLRSLRLSHCSKLTKLPESNTTIKKIPNSIELIELVACPLIIKIPCWIGSARNLNHLLLSETRITELPNAIGLLGNLVELSVSKCRKLVKLPDSMGKMKSLKSLYMLGTSIVKLPEDFGQLLSLEKLNLKFCRLLKSLPVNFENLVRLKDLDMEGSGIVKLPDDFKQLSSLQKLNINLCHFLKSLPKDFGNLVQLRNLDMDESGIVKLPDDFGQLPSLECLHMDDCQELECLPNNFGNLIQLTSLCMKNTCTLKLLKDFIELSNSENLRMSCSKGESLLENIGNPAHLRAQYARKAFEDALASVIGKFSSLENLDLSGNHFYSLPATIGDLSVLRYLSLDNCTKLQVLPELPSSLVAVVASNCISLERFPVSNLHNLTDLILTNCTKLQVISKPPPSLKYLDVRNCTSLERFPDVPHLRNIQDLLFSNCTKVQGLLARVCGIAQSNVTNFMSNSVSPSQVLLLPKLFRRLRCLCFSGSNIPDWFIPLQFNQRPDDSSTYSMVSFIEVAEPRLSNTDFDITGLIVWIVFATDGVWNDPTSLMEITVEVMRNDTILSFSGLKHDNESITNTHQDHDQTCLFFFTDKLSGVLKNGDQIQLSVYYDDIDVKKSGFFLIYKSNEDTTTMQQSTSSGSFDDDEMSTSEELLDVCDTDFSDSSGSGLGEVDRHSSGSVEESLDFNAIDFSVSSGSVEEVNGLSSGSVEESKANEPDKDELDPCLTLAIPPHSLNASSSNTVFGSYDLWGIWDQIPPNPKKPKKNPPTEPK